MKRLLNRLRRWLRRRRLRRVCKALDILPYPWQAEFALTDDPGRLPDMGRRTGKTMAVILRALVQPDGEGALSFIAYDPDADMSKGVQRSIYDDYRRAHAICVRARAIPNRPPLPLRTIPCRPRGLTASTITMEDLKARYREEIGPVPEDPEDLPDFFKKKFNLPPSVALDAGGYEEFKKNLLHPWLRHILDIQSPSAYFTPSSWPPLPEPKQPAADFYKPENWEKVKQQALQPEPEARPFVGVDLASHPDMTSGLPLRPVTPKLLPAGAARSAMIGKAIADGMAAGLEAPPAVLYADNKPVVTFRTDGIDALSYALRKVAEAAREAAAALGTALSTAVRAVGESALIAVYATPKEVHYIKYGRKARTRKKYRNRVLRRARRARAKEARP